MDAFLPFWSEKDCIDGILLSEGWRGGRLQQRVIWTSSVTDPFSFVEPLMLHTRTGWGSRVVSSWCFCMKLWFMNMPVALESRSMDVEMDASEVREVSSTLMLRE